MPAGIPDFFKHNLWVNLRLLDARVAVGESAQLSHLCARSPGATSCSIKLYLSKFILSQH